ncbi:MAG: MurR/RpiR family transcriptional regulator [Lachnospiraceae bacterium]|nr:MurR/RpiR family transcriptional regulator [Lachnospiraceae bacterium]
MEYYVKSVVPIIKMNYEKFTTVEKSIADFFISNQEKVDLSSRSISDRLYVSEASLSRFAQKCGYRGYREFVYQYESTFIEDTSSITKGTRLILNSYQELLNKVYSLVDEEQIARIARYLGEATRVLVCGKGSSGHAAEEMELRFMRIGVNIDSLRDSDLIRMQAIFQSKQNLVFGITISGEAEDVLFLLREARRRGAKTVLITAHNNDQFYEFCSEIVLMPSLKYLNQGNVISPQFPILLMLDLIYACYSGLDKGIKERMHGNTLRTLSAGIKKSKGRE